MTLDIGTILRRATKRLSINASSRSRPSVKDLLDKPEQVMTRFQGARVAKCRTGPPTDTPLKSLYRLYQFFVVGWTTAARAEMRYFWQQESWLLIDIPDPLDVDEIRYAIVAVLVRVLCKEFNGFRIERGLARGSAITTSPPSAAGPAGEQSVSPTTLSNTDETHVDAKTAPIMEGKIEAVPAWVSAVPRVTEKGGGWVRLPGVRGVPDEHDQGLSEDFWVAGILVEEPHLRLQ
ncbi:hypothetical protein FRB94_004040 [Tulasnella sp. JGI-2019a]|nr:hypothetical protein FRB94_004040 [Tulasnella sp. JGI-2019a]KAG9010387.1 hypothetical protein FRB93_004227 [Tulasnella sp. JGI-2019a]KAG9038679.1 hypothetical protein FRB95_000269 [Tulasnella sp. JGI-2019a]